MLTPFPLTRLSALGLLFVGSAVAVLADEPGALPYYNRLYLPPGQGYIQLGTPGFGGQSYFPPGAYAPGYGNYLPYSSSTFVPGGYGSFVPPVNQPRPPFSQNLGNGTGTEFYPQVPIYYQSAPRQTVTEYYRQQGTSRISSDPALTIPPSPLSPVSTPKSEIRIRLPEEEAGPVSYVLNGQTYTMRPGEAQVVQADRDWKLKVGEGPEYSLTAGIYKFLNREGRWNLYRARDVK